MAPAPLAALQQARRKEEYLQHAVPQDARGEPAREDEEEDWSTHVYKVEIRPRK